MKLIFLYDVLNTKSGLQIIPRKNDEIQGIPRTTNATQQGIPRKNNEIYDHFSITFGIPGKYVKTLELR